MSIDYKYDHTSIVPEVIVCAAIKFLDGKFKDIIVTSPRHFDLTTHKLLDAMDFERRAIPNEQGFMTNKFRFVSREEAWEIALKNNQIVRNTGTEGVLFSENLY